MKFSLCLPTRERADKFKRMQASARDTASGEHEIEFVCLIDSDDPQRKDYPSDIVRVRPPRRKLAQSDMWNACAAEATGDILMMCADDLVFKTEGWDAAVASEFARVPDGILMVYCEDGTPYSFIATHPFISRQWVEATGRMTAPYYEAWHADTWILDLSNKVGRNVRLRDVLIEHQHFDYGLGEDDATYRNRRPLRPAGHLQDRPHWVNREQERLDEAWKLWAAMDQSLIIRDSPTDTEWLDTGLRLDNCYWQGDGLDLDRASLSFAIQHTPRRDSDPVFLEMVRALRSMGVEPDVVTDPTPGLDYASTWRTYAACLRQTPRDATHRVVLQDDIALSPNFVAGVTAAVRQRPDNLLSFFMSRRPERSAIAHLSACDRGETWSAIEHSDWVPTQAVAWPSYLIPPMLRHAARKPGTTRHNGVLHDADDQRIGAFIHDRGLTALQSMPSLCEHMHHSTTTLDPGVNHTGPQRAAVCWLAPGTGVDPCADIDWRTGVY